MSRVQQAVSALVVAGIAIAAGAQVPGAPDLTRIKAGIYKVDTNHTQVNWTVNHLGIAPLSGAIGASGGTLRIDPADPKAAKVSITFVVADMTTISPAFTKHLSGADFFNVAKYPTATFSSVSVQPSGGSAKIIGNLTVKGVTKPVALNARFFGAGINPMSKKTNLGFVATASIKRSDFGLGYAAPAVGDELELAIHATFTS